MENWVWGERNPGHRKGHKNAAHYKRTDNFQEGNATHGFHPRAERAWRRALMASSATMWYCIFLLIIPRPWALSSVIRAALTTSNTLSPASRVRAASITFNTSIWIWSAYSSPRGSCPGCRVITCSFAVSKAPPHRHRLGFELGVFTNHGL